jgi:PQQ-dependent dehydrogenase (methanol/ethanol family)
MGAIVRRGGALLLVGIAITMLSVAAASATDSLSEWRLIGRNPGQWQYSPLRQITDKNVGKLGLLWSVTLPSKDGAVGVPLVADGVIYESVSRARVFANDVRTGKLLWSFDPHVEPPAGQIVSYWGAWVNRGVALWKNLVFVGTGDCRLIAIDRQSGKEVWQAQACDPKLGYTITGAPRVGDGKVFIGNANADTGANRGFVEAYDARIGKRLWRFYTIPGDPAKGFESKWMADWAKTWPKDYWKGYGGGSAWDAITYDPVLNQVYFGTDGAVPPQPNTGAGMKDELCTTCIIAVNADSGRLAWYFQTTPHDLFNYDATMHIMIAELTIKGVKHRVVMEAPKSGFFYVLDAKSGKLLTANNFVPVTWASGIDIKTGRPIWRPGANWQQKRELVVYPSVLGAHNWQPMSYNPQTGLVYIPTMNQPMAIIPHHSGPELVGGGGEAIVDLYSAINDPKQFNGGLVAYDPVSAKVVWRHVVGPPQNGGVLSTAGNLVFQGTSAGFLRAYRANDGKRLWEFRSDGGFYAAPITVRIEGRQLVIVPSGSGTSSSVFTYSRMGGITHGPSRLLAFVLGGDAKLTGTEAYVGHMPKPQMPRPAAALAMKGHDVFYGEGCDLCHGEQAIGPEGASIPDLRRSQVVTSAAFRQVVIGGALAPAGMPSFAGKIDSQQLAALRAYIVRQAWAAYDREHSVTN